MSKYHVQTHSRIKFNVDFTFKMYYSLRAFEIGQFNITQYYGTRIKVQLTNQLVGTYTISRLNKTLAFRTIDKP